MLWCAEGRERSAGARVAWERVESDLRSRPTTERRQRSSKARHEHLLGRGQSQAKSSA